MDYVYISIDRWIVVILSIRFYNFPLSFNTDIYDQFDVILYLWIQLHTFMTYFSFNI